MTKDFDAELNSIFSEREARNAKARQEAAQHTAATAAFAKAWDQLRTHVVGPALDEAVGALARKGVTADIGKVDNGVCLYVHVSEARLARGRDRDGQPYLAVVANANTQRVRFERNNSGVGRGDGIGDIPLDEVDTDMVKTKVLTLIRDLFSER
jgi:hypothetical protein